MTRETLNVFCGRWLFGLAGLGLLVPAGWANEPRTAPVARYVEGEVLVRYHSAAHRRALASDPDFTPEPSQRRPLRAVQRLDGRPVEIVRIPGRRTVELLDFYSRHPAVESVTPNYIRRIQRQSIPDDPHFDLQWGLLNTGQTVNGVAGTAGADIRAPRAWPMSRPVTQEVVIAVIDTGVDYRHPDLAPVMWTNPGEQPDSGQDDDENGYIDDYYGYDFSGAFYDLGDGDFFIRPPGPDPMDIDGHGTHVAGIAAAAANNAVGIAGVADARIMALKASPDGEDMPLADSIEAIAYAVIMKVDYGIPVRVINASYGGFGDPVPAEFDLIELAGAAGIVFCAAAGNSYGNDNDVNPFYPASYQLDNVVAVAASDQNDLMAGFSNYGSNSVHLAAPGNNILSGLPLWDSPQAGLSHGTTNYAAQDLQFAGFTNSFTAPAYDCGLGYPHQFPAEVAGGIAVIERGELFFFEKIENAMAAGAAAAVVYNNELTSPGTLLAPENWIPAVSIAREDGLEILAQPQPATLTLSNLPDPEAAFIFMQGTSMSTPYVAGAIAFLARQFPDDTPPQRIARLLDNVDVLPAFSGSISSGGRLNLLRAVDSDADGLPDWWELDWVGNLDDMDGESDYDGNGFRDLHEYLAGTDPTDPASALTISGPPATDGAGFAIDWQSVTNRWYDVQRGTNLAQGFSVTVATNLPGQPPVNSWTDQAPPAGAEAVFYRVRLAE